MRAIGRVVGELIGVVLTGFVGFFVSIAALMVGAVGYVLLAVCALASAILTFMSLFCALGWFFTHKQHELVNAGGFLIEAAIPFTVIVLLVYYRDKATRAFQARRERKAALRRIGRVRLASRSAVADASYDP